MPDAHGVQLCWYGWRWPWPAGLCWPGKQHAGGTPFSITFHGDIGTLSILAGITLYYTPGIPIYGVSDAFVDAIGRGQVLGLPPVLLLAVAVIAIAIVLQRRTELGRHFYVIGGNAAAARCRECGRSVC
ncbi:hypothetical protein [Mesorhizobium sp.]|uniref:hypothetical protein n=1 Tax=Mesorhizobium sp. TaxID=1871066 RepID=UPI0025E59F54|nr:hypothetical protein [Mesorhizobium sp.]